MITELNDRSREVFRRIVEAYPESGEPIGSRTLSRRLGLALSPAAGGGLSNERGLSPATIRNLLAGTCLKTGQR